MTADTPLGRGRWAHAWACPVCRTTLTEDGDGLRCPRDGERYPEREGIWRFLGTAGAARWQAFIDHYRQVRQREGWASRRAPEAFRALPEVPRNDPHAAVWAIRAVSYRTLVRRLVEPAGRAHGRALTVVDLGAGNGWLAHRLARRGHAVAAVDLDDHPYDGLGAASQYGQPPPFVAVQADFTRLPWACASFDLAVWNGSLHYADDIEAALAEALRVLRPDGRLAILDTPFYRRAASGTRMVAERDERFRACHGAASPVRHESFLTLDRLHTLGRALGIRWRVHRPWYGLSWALRPLKNRLLGLREPNRFFVVDGGRDIVGP